MIVEAGVHVDALMSGWALGFLAGFVVGLPLVGVLVFRRLIEP